MNKSIKLEHLYFLINSSTGVGMGTIFFDPHDTEKKGQLYRVEMYQGTLDLSKERSDEILEEIAESNMYCNSAVSIDAALDILLEFWNLPKHNKPLTIHKFLSVKNAAKYLLRNQELPYMLTVTFY